MLRQQMEEEKAKAEAARMAELEAMRVQKQMEEIKKKNEEDRLRMQLEAAGMDASILAKVTATGEGIAVIDRAALEKEMRDKAIKQKEQELRQRTEQARRLDYLVRALREVERAKAAVAQQKAVEEAKSYVSTKNADTLAKAQEKHKVAIENKAHLAKILPYMKEYEDKILKQRMEIYQKKRVSWSCYCRCLLPSSACLLALP
jgi:translation initiation factor 3 subunit A